MSEITVGSKWQRTTEGGLVEPGETVVVDSFNGQIVRWSPPRGVGCINYGTADWFRDNFEPVVDAPVVEPTPDAVLDHAAVARPSHYDFAISPMDAIRCWGLGFSLGNVIKYCARAGRKGSRLADLLKAREYLDDEITACEKEAAK